MLKPVLSSFVMTGFISYRFIADHIERNNHLKNLSNLRYIKKRIDTHINGIKYINKSMIGLDTSWSNICWLESLNLEIHNDILRHKEYLETYGRVRDIMYSVEEYNKSVSENKKVKILNISEKIINNACVSDIIIMYEINFTTKELENLEYYKFLKNIGEIYPFKEELFQNDYLRFESKL